MSCLPQPTTSLLSISSSFIVEEEEGLSSLLMDEWSCTHPDSLALALWPGAFPVIFCDLYESVYCSYVSSS